jgi:hypothetical protein
MLKQATQDSLTDLLHQCLVRVEVGNGHGAGFFVAPGRVLTAFHVVQEAIETGAPIELVTGSDRRPANVDQGAYRPVKEGDVALLQVESDPEQPCVILDDTSVPAGVGLATAGFPEGSEVPIQTRYLTSGGDRNWSANNIRYLRVDDDPLVGGMSGGPVLNLATGFVSGVVRLTLDPLAPTGGFATPTAVVITALPELRDVHDFPSPASKKWCDVLTPLHLKEHRRHEDGARWDARERTAVQIDLSLHPQGPKDSPLSEWEIKVNGEAIDGGHLHGSALGTDVLDAVDLWSQRRVFGRDDSLVVGRILYRALLPDPVERRLEKAIDQKGRVLLRVKVSADDRLSKIPWEYALRVVPGKRGAPARPDDDSISTRPKLAFSRFVDTKSKSGQQAERIRVLMAIVRPTSFRERSAGTHELSGTAERAGPTVQQRILRKDQTAERIELNVLVDPALDAFERALAQEGPWNVVHYVGFGSDGNAQIAPTIAFVQGAAAASTTQLAYFMRLITAHQTCRLVVAQLCSTPGDRTVSSLDPRKLLDVLAGPVQALVVGQHAATPEHVLTFCQPFYDALADGDPVEFAVQKARRAVVSTPPAGDAAAFGTITVTTTSSGELRLLTRTASSGREVPTQSTRARSETDQQTAGRLSR